MTCDRLVNFMVRLSSHSIGRFYRSPKKKLSRSSFLHVILLETFLVDGSFLLVNR
jgi:hypothetical protein